MKKMSLLSSIFRSKEKEGKCIEIPRGSQTRRGCNEISSHCILEKEEVERNHKASVCVEGREYKLIKILPQFIQSFQGELKNTRLEMGSPKEDESRAESRFAHGEEKHAAAHHSAQCSQGPRSILRWRKGADILHFTLPEARILVHTLEK